MLAQPLSADAGPDTVFFTQAPGFATITGSDYIPLVLDPPVGAAPNPNFEVVHITAYTAGQLSATIQRAQESTTAHGHNANAIWAVGPTAGDYMGEAPVGAIVPYAGSGDPPETNWVIADGRLIDRTTYADFFARSGHSYNGGVDPLNNKVKIPDKRGKQSMGAINMGTGVGPNDNSHSQAARGSSGGANQHAHTAELAVPPLSVNSHSHPLSKAAGAQMGFTESNGIGYIHFTSAGIGFPTFEGPQIERLRILQITGIQDTDGHLNGVALIGSTDANSSTTGTGTTSGTTDNATTGDPYEADSYIVRIA